MTAPSWRICEVAAVEVSVVIFGKKVPRTTSTLPMAAIELRFLGDLQVLRDGQAVALPPSRKTRALLAYLAMQPRAFRREALCELLWEIPDDPRGSLRWSLSKLRRLVDDDQRARVVADRSHVRFDSTGVDIDALALRALADEALDAAPIETLEHATEHYRGNFLEGLDLANFHDFHAWCVAEREAVTRAQTAVLRTLIDRLTEDPQRAVRHARRLVTVDPYDVNARAALIRLLVELGHSDEAEQQYLLGTRMQKEVGAAPDSALFEAWRGPPGGHPTRTAPAAQAPQSAMPAATTSATSTALADTATHSPPSLVGRDAEHALLQQTCAEVAGQRQARLVLLRGEPGIGKTHLIESAVAVGRAAGARILRASAFESETMRPFGLWIDALREVDGPATPGLFSNVDHDNRDRLFAALAEHVARAADAGLVLLVFDDLQWCDESSAAALHYVARSNRHRPVLGVLAARDEELRDNAAVLQVLRGLRHERLLREVRLGPLTAGALQTLIRSLAPGVDADAIGRECGGNPLLAIELARAEAAGDSGSSLDELVHERLARLDNDCVEVLRWAAVLTPRLDVSTLARATGLDPNRIGTALEAAEHQAILLGSDHGLRFSHDLVARSVYGGISPTRRRIMHRRAAELLEQDTALDLGHAADLAHHAAQSGEPALAARAMVSAGRLCLRFFANQDAVALARQGLQWAAQLQASEQVCLTLELRDILLSAAPLDDWQTAADEYVILAEQALDHGALAHARLGYQMASYVRWANGQWAGAREESLQAERVTRSAGDLDHITGMAETAKCLAMLERDLSQADALLMEAQALAQRQRISYPAIPAALGMLRFHENRLDEAEELFKEARTLCKAAGDRLNEFQTHEYLVMIAFERGDYAGACQRCQALLEIGEKLRDGSEAPFARALDGLCRYALQDDDAGLEAALEDLRIADAKHRLAYTLTRAALLDVGRGRPHQALTRARQALDHATTLERATEMMLAHVVLAQASEAAGDVAARNLHLAAIADLADAPVAQWARERAGVPATAD
jgi:DNA-binding SARP family transcriptional activator/predicted ATPase